MNPQLTKIHQAFSGKLVGNDHMQYYVCETLSLMPQTTIDRITESCWFMSSLESAWAYTFSGNDLADQHLVFISDDLLRQNPLQICFSIAHEIGHITLGHKNSVAKKQSKSEISKHEKAADKFAQRYISLT